MRPVSLQRAPRPEALDSRIAGTNVQSAGGTGFIECQTLRRVHPTCIGACAQIAAGKPRARLGSSSNPLPQENCGKVVARILTSLPRLTSLTDSCWAKSTTCAPSKLGESIPPYRLICGTVRVPAVYPGSALLAFLSLLSERGMNNLHAFNGLDGSIPTAPTKFLDDSIAFTPLST